MHCVSDDEIAAMLAKIRRLEDRLERAGEVRVTIPSPERPDVVWLGCGVKVRICIDHETKRPYLEVVKTPTVSLA